MWAIVKRQFLDIILTRQKKNARSFIGEAVMVWFLLRLWKIAIKNVRVMIDV
jgi:hypothetical protein